MSHAFPYIGAALLASMILVLLNLERLRSSPLGQRLAVGYFIALLTLSLVVGYLIVFGAAETIQDAIISLIGGRF